MTTLAPVALAGSDLPPEAEPADDAPTIEQRLARLELKVDALVLTVNALASDARALADAAGQVTAKLNGGGLMGLLTGFRG